MNDNEVFSLLLRVEAEAKEYMDRLSLAERLTNGLASEKERWSLTVEGFKACEVTMAGWRSTSTMEPQSHI